MKETKLNRIDRMFRQIRERTGLSRSLSEAIADAFVRGRDVAGLAIQKGWPIDGGVILGPEGDLEVAALAEM